MITKGICADCGKECDKRAKRCRECHTNNVLNKSPNRGKNKRARSLPPNYCVDCGEEIKYDSVRCNKCHPKWLATQESWLEGNKERVQEFWDNVDEEWYEEWIASNKEAAQNRLDDPEWWKAWRAGMSALERGASKLEEDFSELLTKSNIDHKRHVNIGHYEVDVLIGDNFIVELYGDYWHSTQEAIRHDKKRNRWLRNKGYTILIIWESEFRSDPDFCIRKVKRKEEGPLIMQTLF